MHATYIDGEILKIDLYMPHMPVTVKQHFYTCENLCKFVKTGLLINLCDFYLCSNALCIVMYGAIKICAVQIYATCV